MIRTFLQLSDDDQRAVIGTDEQGEITLWSTMLLSAVADVFGADIARAVKAAAGRRLYVQITCTVSDNQPALRAEGRPGEPEP